MMGVLFLVGIGWVLWESHAAGKAGPTDREGSNAVMVQAGLADMNRVVARDSAGQGGVVANFYHKASERQVPLAALPVNPFITFGWEPPPGKDQLVEAKENSAPAAPSAPPVKQLQLQSVLVMGNNSSAISTFYSFANKCWGMTKKKITAKERKERKERKEKSKQKKKKKK